MQASGEPVRECTGALAIGFVGGVSRPGACTLHAELLEQHHR